MISTTVDLDYDFQFENVLVSRCLNDISINCELHFQNGDETETEKIHRIAEKDRIKKKREFELAKEIAETKRLAKIEKEDKDEEQRVRSIKLNEVKLRESIKTLLDNGYSVALIAKKLNMTNSEVIDFI